MSIIWNIVRIYALIYFIIYIAGIVLLTQQGAQVKNILSAKLILITITEGIVNLGLLLLNRNVIIFIIAVTRLMYDIYKMLFAKIPTINIVKPDGSVKEVNTTSIKTTLFTIGIDFLYILFFILY